MTADCTGIDESVISAVSGADCTGIDESVISAVSGGFSPTSAPPTQVTSGNSHQYKNLDRYSCIL